MEKIEVIILENKTSAKEVNPFKAEIERKYDRGGRPSLGLIDKYNKHESTLRTFEIETIKGLAPEYIIKTVPKLMEVGIGSRHEANVLPNGKIKIL